MLPLWVFSRVTGALLLLPVASGFIYMLVMAMGFIPGLERTGFSLLPIIGVFQDVRILSAAFVSLASGVIATIVAFISCQIILALFFDICQNRALQRALALFLSVPHFAFALGFAFLLVPSGLYLRVVSLVFGLDVPPQAQLLTQQHGIMLTTALALREIPFFFFLSVSALGQFPAARYLMCARTMGYKINAAWWLVIVPQLTSRLRLGIYAVLIFATSVVDMPIVLGPSLPSPLALLIKQRFQDIDLSQASSAAVMTILLVGVALLAIALWEVLQKSARPLFYRILLALGRKKVFALKFPGRFIAFVFAVSMCMSLVSMIVWSFAFSWPWPNIIPTSFTMLAWWEILPSAASSVMNSVFLALLSSALGMLLVISVLELEDSALTTGRSSLWQRLVILYIPLLVPQTAFLYGIHLLAIFLGIDQFFMVLVWVHLIFVVPYCYLSLVDVWKNCDVRYFKLAATLGMTPFKRLIKIRLPMLFAPIFTSFALGFSVSFAQYLPNVLIANSFPTLSVEAVSLASGGNMSYIGVLATLQIIVPMLVFYLALTIPQLKRRIRFAFEDVKVIGEGLDKTRAKLRAGFDKIT